MKPIADYGLLGDTRTAALVSSDGSIDWLCVPRFDGDPIFGRLVGGPAAGRFRLGPATAATVVERKYRQHTATLETTWATADGKLTLTEAMVAEVAGRLLPRRSWCGDCPPRAEPSTPWSSSTLAAVRNTAGRASDAAARTRVRVGRAGPVAELRCRPSHRARQPTVVHGHP